MAPPASELVSGPDLGAGFLHQLSLDRLGEGTTFTHHAQVGGQDANGPPRGGLDPLGFVHPESACMFGGPRCWHRRFLLPFSELPRVRFAYQRFRFVLATMMGQVYGDVEVPIDAAVRELVGRLSGPLAQEGVPWYIGGSTAGRLLGGDLRPKDVDLGTSRAGVDRLGALLAEYLIEPVAPTDWSGGRLVRAGRAFVGTPAQGARVEWSVPLEGNLATGPAEFGSDPARVRTLEVTVAGAPASVSRPEYGLVRSVERARAETIPAWVALVRKVGADLPLLDALFAGSTAPSSEKDRLRREVRA